MEESKSQERRKTDLIQASSAFALFCGISALSRIIDPLFFLMVILGIAFPMIWAKRYHGWNEIGFQRKNLLKAVFLGVGAGLLTGIYTYLVIGRNQIVPDALSLQLIVGSLIWFMIMSPFQEFFFRGWLQSRFERSIGKWRGLFLASACFTVWHFFPPFEGTSTSIIPITSFIGVASTFLFGIVFGFIFQRTNNIIAPWIAHALAGVAAIYFGLMSFLQYSA